MSISTRDCDMDYHWCDRCYWGKPGPHTDGDPPSFKVELRKIVATQLWFWAIKLKCWAWGLDQQHVAKLDSELRKPRETGL